jgi:hypothetical protein
MIRLLLVAILFGQIPGQQSGAVSGILKGSDGRPIAGIRVAAVPRPDAITDASATAAMSAIAETDVEGHYTLENVPPGHYYIAAGRVGKPTYYPGASEVSAARDIAITAGQKLTGIDFVVGNTSVGRNVQPGELALPVVVTVEGGGPIPLSGAGKMTELTLQDVSRARNGLATLADGFVIFFGAPGAYRLTVANLPSTYVVKSMAYDNTDLLTTDLQLVPVDSSLPTSMPQPLTTPRALALVGEGNIRRYLPITITLGRVPHAQTAGVRVSGRVDGMPTDRQAMYLSNIPGDIYTDGTFEFFDVPPGRHSIVTVGGGSIAVPFAASVVVGGRDVSDVVLPEASLMADGRWKPSVPRPAGKHAVGNVPLARIFGNVVEEQSGKPVADGSVVIKSTAYYSDSFSLDAEGRYEIPALLPGTYELELQAFGHTAIKRSVELDDESIKVDFAPRKIR